MKEKLLRDLMSETPVTLDKSSTVAQAARRMKDSHVGNVLVVDDAKLFGIVTDRDIVVRCTAEGKDPSSLKLADICSKDLMTVSPDQKVDEAISMMKARAIRRLPVVDDEKPIGIVSIGDLAMERDRESVLGEISAAPSNQ